MAQGMDVRPLILGMAFVIGTAAGAWAGEAGRFSGDTLASYCSSPYDVDAGYCAGYVTAIAEIMTEQPLYGFHACNLAGIRSQQLMEIVAQDLKKTDEDSVKSDNARFRTAGALARAFPCH